MFRCVKAATIESDSIMLFVTLQILIFTIFCVKFKFHIVKFTKLSRMNWSSFVLILIACALVRWRARPRIIQQGVTNFLKHFFTFGNNQNLTAEKLKKTPLLFLSDIDSCSLINRRFKLWGKIIWNRWIRSKFWKIDLLKRQLRIYVKSKLKKPGCITLEFEYHEYQLTSLDLTLKIEMLNFIWKYNSLWIRKVLPEKWQVSWWRSPQFLSSGSTTT